LESLPSAVRQPLAWTGTFVVLLVGALVATRPLAWSLGSGTLDPIDGVLNTWIMAWGAKALVTDPAAIFQAPFFYPAAHALAFSENLIGNLPLFGPLYALSGDPFWATDAFTVLSVLLTGLATFGLAYHWTRSRIAALAAALFFALSPLRLSQVNHLQLFGIWWSPLALWMASRFLRHGRWKDAALMAGFLAAQFASSIYLGYFLLTFLGSYLLVRVLMERSLWRRDLAVKASVSFAAAGVVLLPILLPYLRLREAWGMGRSLRDGTALGADVLSYLTAWPGSALYGGWLRAVTPLYAHEKMLFPGLVVLVAALVACRWARRQRHERLAGEVLAMGGAGLIAAVLSLGPTLQIAGKITFIPLPYAALFYLVPGFGAVRVPARFGLMVALALALLAGVTALLALRRWGDTPRRRALIAGAILVLALADTWTRPLTRHPSPQPTELDAFLAKRAEGPVITVPMPTYKNEADGALEASRMISGLTHGLPMVNGYSGFFPQSFLELARQLERGPDPRALDALAAVGVKTLVIRLDQMPSGLRERWAIDRKPAASGLVPLWFEEGTSAVYHLTRRPTPADLLYASLLLPERLPAGWQFTMGVALDVPAKTIWTAPLPPQRQPLTVRWDGPAQQSQVTRSVWLPLTVQGPEVLGIPLRTPARPGRYQVTVEGASLRATASVEVMSWQAADTLSAPLDARLTWDGPRLEHMIVPGSVLPLRLDVQNQGENVWRANTTWRQRLAAHPEWLRQHPRWIFDRGAGEVMLEVRWLSRRSEAELTQGAARIRRYPLRHDVFPGQRYVFDESLFIPERPGGYFVEFRLTDAFGTFSSPVERHEVLVHELAGMRGILRRYEGM
jgi:hypothetical protein